jgi:hypothetical protein
MLKLDFDSPLTKAINKIREIRGLDTECSDNLQRVEYLLHSPEVYKPKMYGAVQPHFNEPKRNTTTSSDLSSQKALWRNDSSKQSGYSFNRNATASTDFISQNLPKRHDSIKQSGYNKQSLDEIRQYNEPKRNNINQSAKYILPIKIIQSTNPQITELLKTKNAWSFNIFEFEKVTGGRPLFYLGMSLFESCDLENNFQCKPEIVQNFLIKLESSYRKNPYHSSTHAADV